MSVNPGQEKKITVAVIEDNDDVRNLLSLILGEFCKVVAFRSAEEACPALAAEAVQIILTDFRLPDLNGIDVRIKLRERGVMTPVVLVTGYVMGSSKEKALAGGFAAFLSKPILDMQEMVDLIRGLAA